jgi:hypothetical protein
VLSSRVPRWIGIGPTIAHTQLLSAVAWGLTAAAAVVRPDIAVAVMVLSQAVLGVARVIFNVTQVSLRQALTPDRLLGRMNASIRFLMWCVTPVGAVTGGLLAGTIGLPQTVAIGAAGTLVATAWVYLPTVWRIRTMPAMAR